MPTFLRTVELKDLPFLQHMLFEAFFWDTSSPRPDFEVFSKTNLEYKKLLARWGRPGDLGVIAESNAVPTGACWYRFWTDSIHSYGYVDPQTPEIALGVDTAFRRQGIGRALLDRLLEMSLEHGIEQISLSVDPRNHALHLYQSAGFVKIGKNGTSWTMLWQA